MDSHVPMSGPPERLSAEANRDEARQEEQEQREEERSRIEQKTHSPSGVPLVARLYSQTIPSPHQSGFDVSGGLSGRFPAYHDPIGRPRSRSLSELPVPLNTVTDIYWNLPHHHLSFPVTSARPLPTTRDFFGLLPAIQQLQEQRLDQFASSSLELDLLASAMSCRRHSVSLSLPSNIELAIQLAAGQRANATLLYQPKFLSPTSYLPKEWSSPEPLVGDTNALSLLPSHPPPQTGTLPMPCASATTSALSSPARVAAERALPFSAEEESRIPLLGRLELFPMVLHRALAELELVADGRTIAAFLPDGRSFRIKDQALFTKKIMPVFFPKMKGFASFQRQLNLYNFERVAGVGLNRGAYRHKLFVRDYPAMSSSMRRIKMKCTRPRGKPNSSSKKNEAENDGTNLTSTGEGSSMLNDNTDLADGKGPSADAQNPEDKTNIN